MPLTHKEKYDAEIIKEHFSGEYSEVEQDPPDIYLEYSARKVAVELTELSPNLQNNKISVNKSYEGFIKNMRISIPDYIHYCIVFHHANIKLNKSRRKKIKNFINNQNGEVETCIDGIFVKIKPSTQKEKKGVLSVVSFSKDSCNKDVNAVLKSINDINIESSFNFIINKAIETKKGKCKNISEPIWLAMHDNYFSYAFSQSKNECIELYENAIKKIDFGIFEKIIITFKDREIIVFDREPTI